MLSHGPLLIDTLVLADHQKLTYSEDIGCRQEDLPSAMIDKDQWREREREREGGRERVSMYVCMYVCNHYFILLLSVGSYYKFYFWDTLLLPHIIVWKKKELHAVKPTKQKVCSQIPDALRLYKSPYLIEK